MSEPKFDTDSALSGGGVFFLRDLNKNAKAAHRKSAEAMFSASRSPISTPILRVSAKALDVGAAVFCLLFALALAGVPLLSSTLRDLAPFLLMAVFGPVAMRMSGTYHHVKRRGVAHHLGQVSLVGCIGLVVAFPLATLLAPSGWHQILFGQGLWSLFAILALHANFKGALSLLMRTGRLSQSAVIVGATDHARNLIERNEQTRDLEIVGIFDDRLDRVPERIAGVPVMGDLGDLLTWDNLPAVDQIIVTVTSTAEGRVRALIDRLRYLPHRVVLLLDLDGFQPENEDLAKIADTPAAFVSGAPQDLRRALVKRVTDVVLATAMVVIFLPVMLGCAVAVKASSAGPVLFRQRRHGFNNQIIRVWKFRTMRDDPAAANVMTRQASADDDRITGVGRFLRKTSLDELPQLFNVIGGSMSLVGPRPHAIGMTAETTEVHDIVSDYAHRHRVKPGLTGWAQVCGSRGPVHTREEVADRVRLDLEYINRSSLWFDLYIMALTLPCLLGDVERTR